VTVVGIGITSAFSCRFCSGAVGLDRVSRAIRAFNSRISGVGVAKARVGPRPVTGQDVAIAGIGFRADGQALAERLGLGRIDTETEAPASKTRGGGFVIDPVASRIR